MTDVSEEDEENQTALLGAGGCLVGCLVMPLVIGFLTAIYAMGVMFVESQAKELLHR